MSQLNGKKSLEYFFMDFLKQCVLMDVRGQRPNQIDDISKSINYKNGL